MRQYPAKRPIDCFGHRVPLLFTELINVLVAVAYHGLGRATHMPEIFRQLHRLLVLLRPSPNLYTFWHRGTLSWRSTCLHSREASETFRPIVGAGSTLQKMECKKNVCHNHAGNCPPISLFSGSPSMFVCINDEGDVVLFGSRQNQR